MKMPQSSLFLAVSCLVAGLCAGSASASGSGIANGLEAQVRIPSGEHFVISSQEPSQAPYVPATPYGYVGYKLESGTSFGLGLGFNYFQFNIPTFNVSNSGWALMAAPTLQVPFVRLDALEVFAVGRFILGFGQNTIQSATPTDASFMTYGGNVGAGTTWYPVCQFGLGAEVGLALNYFTTTGTPVVGGNPSTGANNPNSLYFQTYFSLNANYIF